MGDGVLAYFNYPQAHEDDAERAVQAGLEACGGWRAQVNRSAPNSGRNCNGGRHSWRPHAIDGEGGTIGPDLAGEAQRGRSAASLETQMVSPKVHLTTSIMPATTLAPPERAAVIAYLLSLTPATAAETTAATPTLPAVGEQGPPDAASRMIGDPPTAACFSTPTHV